MSAAYVAVRLSKSFAVNVRSCSRTGCPLESRIRLRSDTGTTGRPAFGPGDLHHAANPFRPGEGAPRGRAQRHVKRRRIRRHAAARLNDDVGHGQRRRAERRNLHGSEDTADLVVRRILDGHPDFIVAGRELEVVCTFASGGTSRLFCVNATVAVVIADLISRPVWSIALNANRNGLVVAFGERADVDVDDDAGVRTGASGGRSRQRQSTARDRQQSAHGSRERVGAGGSARTGPAFRRCPAFPLRMHAHIGV